MSGSSDRRRTPARRACTAGWAPLVVSAVFVATGMAFSLFWAPVVRHHPYWLSSGDLWSTYRGAHYVGWGDLGGVYGSGTGLVTFPGILLLLAPVAMLTGGLGLSESFPKFLPHPAAWLVLGPYEMLLSAVALFATDALAERLGVRPGPPGRIVPGRGGPVVERVDAVGPPRGRLGRRTRPLRPHLRPRRALGGGRMALRRGHGHPAVGPFDATCPARSGWAPTSGRPRRP